MKINIKRDDGFKSYDTALENRTLLETLEHIKHTDDASLCYSSGCRSGVCGSCGVVVNGVEKLACSYIALPNDTIEPLKHHKILRDLVVDKNSSLEFNKKAKAHISTPNTVAIDSALNELQSSCILCTLCYSVCPVYETNSNFLGPFTLTRVWKYVSDKRESNQKEKIDLIQQNGIWDCTLCNACTSVCPQGISSKADIEKLRSRSSMFGYMDPSFNSLGFGGGFDGSPIF